MPIQVTPFTASFGAQIDGVDLRRPLDDGSFEQIEQALAKYSLLSFRKQFVDDEQQLAFSGRFGRIHTSVMDASRKRLKDQRFGDVSNLDKDGRVLAADSDRRKFGDANQLWHTDLSFMAAPARVTVLSARQLPPEPPDTEYADMRAAWDSLPLEMKRKLEPLQVQHSIFASRERAGFTEFTESERKAAPPVLQPLVRVHRRSGRRSLYLSSHASHILGMPLEEGQALLAELTEFATQPQFVFAYRWQPNDLIVWDDSCTMHRARPFDSHMHVRELRWNAVVEPAPLIAETS
jgi:alpha-ketoglutarate-dependent 2,4-dichlorophenoxyacetate dioxygenase